MCGTAEKTCSKCGETKPLAEFYKSAGNSDGHRNDCKPCQRAKASSWYRRNIERQRTYYREKHRREYVPAAPPEPRPCTRCQEIHTRRSDYCSKYCANYESSRQQQKKRTASGADRLRQRRRRAAKKGLTLEQYEWEASWGILLRMASGPRPRPAPRWHERRCSECGAHFFTRTAKKLTCASRCSYLRGKRWILDRYHTDPEFRDAWLARAHARRADKLGLGPAYVVLGYLLERDKWTCGICGERIREYKDGGIDHIVPLSVGCKIDPSVDWHADWNVQAAHRWCNLSKGNRGGNEQLMLVG